MFSRFTVFHDYRFRLMSLNANFRTFHDHVKALQDVIHPNHKAVRVAKVRVSQFLKSVLLYKIFVT